MKKIYNLIMFIGLVVLFLFVSCNYFFYGKEPKLFHVLLILLTYMESKSNGLLK